MLIIIIFLVLLILLLLFIKKVFYNDISSPSQITCYIYFLGSIFSLIGIISWSRASITLIGIIVIFCSLLCFVLGEIFSLFFYKRSHNISSKKKIFIEYKIPKLLRILNVSICLLSLIIYYNRMLEMAIDVGYSGSDDLMQYIRIAINKGSVGQIIVLLSCYCSSLSIVYAYYFFQHVNRKGLKYSIIHFFDYVLVILCALGISYISTSRYNFIKYLAIYLMEFIFTNKRENKIEFKFGKYLRIGISIIIGLFLVFIITGNSRSSFNENTSGLDKFIVYAGSSIPGFCYGIENIDINQTNLFGGTTFTGIYALIEYLGGEHFNYIKFLDVFPLRAGLTSNVYTGQYNLIHDYGYCGLFVIYLIIGFIYGLFYTLALYKKYDTIRIFYSYYVYYLVMQLWNPQLFLDFLSIQWILEIFFICIICITIRFFLKKKQYIK